MTSRDKLTVLENVIGRIGLGGDVLGEYSKALSAMSGLDTYAEMNPAPIPMPQTPTVAPQEPMATSPIENNLPVQ